MNELGRLPRIRRDGREPFTCGDDHLGFELLDFWQWCVSDIVSNATRGVLAEFIVARALGLVGGVRDEWATYDLLDPRGISIEVKSAAYIQSWPQKHYSRISFKYPKTFAWDPEANLQSTEKSRHAEVYIFALLAHKDQVTLNPLDVSQWEFYVVPTGTLDRRYRSQHSITLNSLRDLHGEPVLYSGLKDAVGEAAIIHRATLDSES